MNTAKMLKENKALRKLIADHMLALSEEVESLGFDPNLFYNILLNDIVECRASGLEGKEREEVVSWISSIVVTALEPKL